MECGIEKEVGTCNVQGIVLSHNMLAAVAYVLC